MKLRGIMAVLLLSAVSVCAQGAPAAQDAEKPADHAACMRDKSAKTGCCKKDKDGKMAMEMDCCKKDKDGKTTKGMDCCKGKCAREKMESEKKS